VSADARFWRVLLVVVVAGLGVRIAYVAGAKGGSCPIRIDGHVVFTVPSECAVGDQLYYNATANRIAEGDWYVEPFDTSAHPAPAADHPPLTPFVLAPVSWLGSHWPLDRLVDDPTHVALHRYFLALLGAVVVLLIGLLGREVGGDRVGWAAAAIAAFAPTIWVNDGLIFSETVTNVCVVAALLVAVRLARAPSLARAAWLGAWCALAMLGRAELALFVPLLVVPALVAAYGRGLGGLVRPAIAVAVPVVVIVGPWVGWNLARFDEPVYLSSNVGLALAGSNCGPVYSGGAIGLTSLEPPCTLRHRPPGDQSVESRALQNRAIDYMKAHKRRVPVVMAARVGRTWGVFRPVDMVSYNEGEGRERWVTGLGIGVFVPVLGAGVGGAVLQWRRRPIDAWILVVAAAVVTVAVALTYGQTRFRAPAEPGIAVLAAVAVVAAWERFEARRVHSPPARRPAGA
jgi:4-amino-4-deoxy-L-arabinose transferase-like glycosyltransferase